jgi:DNA-binding transcriptional ArsR family regulator
MVSYHLRFLRKAGWVASEKQGRHVYYFLKRERFQAVSHVLAALGTSNMERAIL